jgi:hypothetical protein
MMENNNELTTEQSKNTELMQFSGLLVGGGAVGSLYLLITKNRSISSWIIPLGMIVVGVELLMKERTKQIQMTGDQIIAQLDELDPIARARVAKYVADQELGRITG